MKRQLVLTLTAFAIFCCFAFKANAQWSTNSDDIYNTNYNTTPPGKVGIGLVPVQDDTQYYKSVLQIHGKVGNNNVPVFSPVPMVTLSSPDVTAKLDIGIAPGGIPYMQSSPFNSTMSLIAGQVSIKSSFSDITGKLGIGGGVASGFSFDCNGKGHFRGGLSVGEEVYNIHYIPTGYTLAVDGKIICEALKVQMSQDWPDYVFGDNYQLKRLDEVEAYIEENKHLPDVPSASEIESNGIDAGEMLKIQMQKIEELTLYMIELKKENEKLKTDMTLLKKKLEIQDN